MINKATFSFVLIIGLLLFALFFGAGNLIFPPMLGQSAGTNLLWANIGFLVTGVGLPLMTVLAFGFSGKNDLLDLASRVHPLFGVVFATTLYLTLGPLFALPRSGSVSFEIGVKPFLSSPSDPIPLTIFTIIFFGITCLLAINPLKIVNVIGKFLTPIKLTFIGILMIVVLIKPIGTFQSPTKEYQSHVFFKGFQNGYLTMDTLGAFVFAIIIVNAIKSRGITEKKQIMLTCLKATVIAGIILAAMYTSLAFMGASSVEKLGYLDNGGQILAQVSAYYFGSYGEIILGLMITIACLTTSVGLMTSCASFFHRLFPALSYKTIVCVLASFSTIVSNVGLTKLIAFSIPVLNVIYPLAIVLVVLTFLHPLFKGKVEVYQWSMAFTFIVSLCEGLSIDLIDHYLSLVLPMYTSGLGWLIPFVIGGLIGFGLSFLRNPSHDASTSSNVLNK